MPTSRFGLTEAAVLPLERKRERTAEVIASGEAVFAGLGAGLAASLYARALALELHARAVAFRRETSVEVRYRGSSLGREPVDFLFEDGALLLVVEPWVSPLQERRARSVAAADGCRWAMVFNFGAEAFEARILERVDRRHRPAPRARIGEAHPETDEPAPEPPA